MVKKTVYSSRARFLFIAGLGGTGHHGWRAVLKGGHLCWPSNFPALVLWHLWFGADEESDMHAENLKRAFEERAQEAVLAGGNNETSALHCLNTADDRKDESMFSYPNNNDKTHHPNVYTLARIAEDAGIDLRIVVLHRHPANQLVSLSLNRDFMDLPGEAHQMSNQGGILNSQLQLIDPDFFVCTPFDSVSDERGMLQAFVSGGMEGRSGNGEVVKAVEMHYRAGRDDVDAAMRRIRNETNGKQIEIKIEEMTMYHEYLKEVLCKRTGTWD